MTDREKQSLKIRLGKRLSTDRPEVMEIVKEEIDNTPIKAVNCKNCDGYEAGYSAGLKDAKRPTGEWIAHWSEDLQRMGFRQCSKCKAGYQLYEHGTRKSDLPWIDGQQYILQRIGNFCPNCGAKMKGGVEHGSNDR